ncbi:sulfatase-like hydrolase/transferase [Thalassotalea sp. PLHSN55]|uniref:sulfatase-like hydrolase/transferase n=1 Tax=Thalassotalea sp. PLHSN55 TaxID=3435888 RepID=UPI003F87DAFA
MFLISEDNSQHYLKLYNANGARMPNIESLAEQGLIFEHAYSNAPVCSTARTTLATGIYGPKIATYLHRAFKQAQLPDGFVPFSQSLKEAGYYTSNNAKTDYNFVGLKQRWNMSSAQATWRDRRQGQPFFHVQTFHKSHEYSLHFPLADVSNKATKHDVNKIKLAPIFPDTQLFRYTHARYLDNLQMVDKEIGNVLKKLQADGVLENTFIFYFGDHGGVLPGSKGYVFERGLHVPLVVRVPKNFQHLLAADMQNPSNTRISGFVSFVDFAPTLLTLAGLPSSKHHDGSAFLGKDISLATLNQRQTTFGHADRFDEKSDLVRTIRVGNFKYIRHYQPYYHDSLFNEYRYKQQAYQQWKNLYLAGKLTPVQATFFQAKSPEALYDISADPYETNNLAGNPKYQGQLKNLRQQLQQQLKSWPDLGFYPESEIVESALSDPIAFGRKHKSDIAKLISIADLQLMSFEQAKPALMDALNSDNSWQQYWALITLSYFNQQASTVKADVYALLASSTNSQVKGRAIEFLTIVDNYDPVAPMRQVIANAHNNIERVALLNIAAYLHEKTGAVFPRPNVNSWPTPKKGSKSYTSDRLLDSWLTARWQYISDKKTH